MPVFPVGGSLCYNIATPPPPILKQLSFNVPNRSGENSFKDFLRRNRLVNKKTKSFKNKFFIICGSDTELQLDGKSGLIY